MMIGYLLMKIKLKLFIQLESCDQDVIRSLTKSSYTIGLSVLGLFTIGVNTCSQLPRVHHCDKRFNNYDNYYDNYGYAPYKLSTNNFVKIHN